MNGVSTSIKPCCCELATLKTASGIQQLHNDNCLLIFLRALTRVFCELAACLCSYRTTWPSVCPFAVSFRPEVTVWGWQDIKMKIQLRTFFSFPVSRSPPDYICGLRYKRVNCLWKTEHDNNSHTFMHIHPCTMNKYIGNHPEEILHCMLRHFNGVQWCFNWFSIRTTPFNIYPSPSPGTVTTIYIKFYR